MARQGRWATCALTQLAFVRLFMNPEAVGAHKLIEEALATLASMVQGEGHVYWRELPAIEMAHQQGAFQRVLGHRQVNDAYLLELARRHGGRLLTFDSRLAALGAAGAAEVLAPGL